MKDYYRVGCSEHNLSLGVFFLTKNNGLASLNNSETLGLGLRAFELKDNLLSLLCLLSEDGLSLTAESLLLHVITSLSLSDQGVLALLVLRHFVNCVFL